jgi:hypothetical protein
VATPASTTRWTDERGPVTHVRGTRATNPRLGFEFVADSPPWSHLVTDPTPPPGFVAFAPARRAGGAHTKGAESRPKCQRRMAPADGPGGIETSVDPDPPGRVCAVRNGVDLAFEGGVVVTGAGAFRVGSAARWSGLHFFHRSRSLGEVCGVVHQMRCRIAQPAPSPARRWKFCTACRSPAARRPPACRRRARPHGSRQAPGARPRKPAGGRGSRHRHARGVHTEVSPATKASASAWRWGCRCRLTSGGG